LFPSRRNPLVQRLIPFSSNLAARPTRESARLLVVLIFHETHRALVSSAVGCERLKFFRFVRGKSRGRCSRRNSAIGRIVSPLNFSEMAANGSECRDIHKARVTNGSSRLRVTLFVKLRVRVSLGIDRAQLRDAREIFATLSRAVRVIRGGSIWKENLTPFRSVASSKFPMNIRLLLWRDTIRAIYIVTRWSPF